MDINQFGRRTVQALRSKANKAKTKVFDSSIFKTSKLAELKEFIQKDKKKFLAGIALLGVFFVSLGAYFATQSYEMLVKGKFVAIVAKKSDALQAVDEMKKELEKDYGVKALDISKDIEFKRVHVDKEKITKERKIIDILKTKINMQVKAVAINIDGKNITFVKDKKVAEKVLKSLKTPYGDSTKDNKVEIIQKVGIKNQVVEISKLKNDKEALNFLLQGSEKLETYEILEKDTAWGISKKLGIKIKSLEDANPNINLEKIKPGQKINLAVSKPYINIKVTKMQSYEEIIPYDTAYEETDALFKGDKKVKIVGQEGKKKIDAKVVVVDGKEKARSILQETILSAPIAKVILTGTKAKPITVALGSFINPTRGSFTSGFGRRWGRLHAGVDIANRPGTSITAADGGVVIKAGIERGYGYSVVINHGNGFTTRYAHCSKLLVKSGQRVARGQQIALMGSTGRSTGSHLHFEVRKNGTPVNPMGYIGR